MIKKYNRCLILILFFGLSISSTLTGAAFRQLSPLINIPTAKEFRPGDIEFATLLSVANPVSTPTGSAKTIDHDFDFMLNYSFTDRLKAGVAMLHKSDLAGYIHSTFFYNGVLGIGAGVTHMSGRQSISAREDFPTTKVNNFSSYITFNLNFFAGNLHVGMGTKDFQTVEGSNGMFFGLELPGLGGNFLIEHDGRDIQFGYRINASEQTNIAFAHTEVNPAGTSNVQYNNAPKRYFAIGLSISQNLSNYYASQKDEVEEYKAAFADLEKDYFQLKEDIGLEKELLADSRKNFRREVEDFKDIMDRMLDEEREEIPTADFTDKTEEYVLELYNKSFEKYQSKDYFKAIQLLSDAIELKPDASFLYERLGSIYYEIGRRDLAVDSWETALEYDPKNEELIELLTQ